MNKVIISGRLTATPEVKQTNSGKDYANFSLAVSRGAKGKDGQYLTDFFTCTRWGQNAKFLVETLKARKGDFIELVGNLQQDKFTGKDGQARERITIVVENIGQIFRNNKAEKPADPAPATSAKVETVFGTGSDDFVPLTDDGDLPF